MTSVTKLYFEAIDCHLLMQKESHVYIQFL